MSARDGIAISTGAAQRQLTQSSNPHPRLRAQKEDEGWHPRKVNKVPVPHLGAIINLPSDSGGSESWSQQVTTMTHTHAQDWSIDTEVAA